MTTGEREVRLIRLLDNGLMTGPSVDRLYSPFRIGRVINIYYFRIALQGVKNIFYKSIAA